MHLRLRRGLAAVVLITSTVLPVPRSADAAAVTPTSTLHLVTASPSVSLTRWVGLPGGMTVLPRLDVGALLVADGAPFEIRARRLAYQRPILAEQVRSGADRALPAALLRDFSGLPGFFRITFVDGSGSVVLDRVQNFCPNTRPKRVRPDAPGRWPYPLTCSTNPFTLGAVWGIETGWGASLVDAAAAPVDLPDGAYTATVEVNSRYRNLFAIEGSAQNVEVVVETRHGGGSPESTSAQPAAPVGPSGDGRPSRNHRPDLRSLPAWGVAVTHGGGEDELAFSATVWNAGPSVLDVIGSRRPGTDVMDAHQVFHTPGGEVAGNAHAGTMEWDARPGHGHWHFTDFANYRLLAADRTEVVRSHKEAFCLANTDPIDYLVPNANWQPSGSDLHSSCGEASSQSVRQVLEVGSGDTYRQTLPGQSFTITDVPNGVYYIQVTANPEGRLYETDERNNTSLRKVVLGGVRGARTVEVPPVGLVDA